MNAKTQIENYVGTDRVKENFDLSPYLTLRTQTLAELYFEANSKEDLIKAFNASKSLKLPFFIIGGGSNLAITKKILPGLVVRNKYSQKKIEAKDNYGLLTVSSGYPITKLAKELAEMGYEGLEYHLGLPGSIGGALYMNSKWTKPTNYVGDCLVSADLIDPSGNVKTVDRKYFNFAYDQSILQKTKETVLEASFKLKKNNPEVLKEHTRFALDYRKKTQPFGVFTSGCFFRNVNGESAGKMVDQAGLKGKRIGKFHVSDKHANFIINDGNGSTEDLKKLLSVIKKTVKDKFAIDLKEEVIII